MVLLLGKGRPSVLVSTVGIILCQFFDGLVIDAVTAD